MAIYVHGSLAFDRIKDFPGKFQDHILADKIHKLNVSFQIQKQEHKRGGCGGNITYSLILLGEQPVPICSVGPDATEYLDFLRVAGVDTRAVHQAQSPLTSSADIITDLDNNQITAFYVGASAVPSQFDLAELSPTDLLILSPANNPPDTLRFVADAKRLGVRYIFDPGQTIPEFDGEQLTQMIDGSFMFTLNDYELELVKAKTGLTEDQLVQKTGALLVTLGDKGSEIRTATETIAIPAFLQDRLVDPTGAGDAYRAGMLVGLQHGLNWTQVGRLGACAASFAIEHNGTQEHHYTLDQFRNRYAEHFTENCPI